VGHNFDSKERKGYIIFYFKNTGFPIDYSNHELATQVLFQEKYTHEPFESKCFCLSLPGLRERGVQIISIQCGFCMGTYLNINNVQCL
jgi:hypothetical protein